MSEQTEKNNSKPKPNRTGRWIIFGLLLGILCGVFFGEYCAGLQVVGNAYVGLLQMTVLPYLVISLIAKMGRMDVSRAKKLGFTALVVLLVLWLLGIGLIVLVSSILPPVQGASFYSPSAASASGAWQDFLSRFIPTNVFRSLSEEYVPAVVVFCLFFGAALMLVPGKEPLLDFLDVCAAGLSQINFFLVRLAPLGLFTLTAAAAGTLRLEEMSKLQAYLILFTLACLVAAFGIMPILVSSLTSIRYREFVKAVQEPVLIAIATGKLFVTLPQIIERCEELTHRHDEAGESASDSSASESTASVLVPLAYPFPHLGKTLAIVFISFAAWYAGKDLTVIQTANVAATGTISSFASPLITIPYFLDQYHLANDLMSLFILPGFITMRLGDMVGVVHLMALTVIVAQFLKGAVRLRWKTLTSATIGLLLCLVVALGASRWYLSSMTLEYDLDQRFLSLELTSPHPDVVVYRDPGEVPSRDAAAISTLERIRKDKSIRVGYFPDAKPFSFVNLEQHLVGLDVELMHRLASRLQIQLEFVPCTIGNAEEQLAEGNVDLVVGGVIMLPERLLRAGFTQPYLSATVAVAVQDYRRDEFQTWQQLAETPDLRLCTNHVDVAAAARRELPNAEVDVIDTMQTYFSGDLPEFDGAIVAAEVGSVWNILHPNHAVVVPQPSIERPVSMVGRVDDQDWIKFLDRWLEFERMEGSLDRLRSYWIEGAGTQTKQPRWCVVRDVLHWLP